MDASRSNNQPITDATTEPTTSPNTGLADGGKPQTTPQYQEIPIKDIVAITSRLVQMVPPKSALASWSIQGISVLVLLQVAEIVTSDPFSLNGAIKFFLLAAGSTRAVLGRTRIKSAPIDLSLPGKQAAKLDDELVLETETAQAMETVKAAIATDAENTTKIPPLT